jgi:hypothetical protein
MSSPEQIEAQITETRARLSTDVDRLNEKVSPSAIAQRRVDSVKSTASSLRDRVMGAKDSAGGGLSSAKDTVAGKASDLGDAASNAPQQIRRQAQGNPLAAGMIAFGVGWLLSSLAPATSAERQVASQAEDKAKELAEPAKQVGQEMAENLKEPLQQAAEQVKSTAADAAQQTQEQAKQSVGDAKDTVQS